MYQDFLLRLARRTGARVFAPDYRLAPEHHMPAAIDDMAAVYKWMLDKRGYSAENVSVGGDSAGGGGTVVRGLCVA